MNSESLNLLYVCVLFEDLDFSFIEMNPFTLAISRVR